MPVSSLIEKIFVINLEHSVERKQHIIDEFKRNGIINYDFFKAISKDSEEVNNILESDFIKKFPPCFRCNKNMCKCKNNFLTPPQVGNWCSFINIMKNLIQHNYNGLIMICEDDIQFTNNKCDRTECNLKKHTDISNNGGTHCCAKCKSNGDHGPLCQNLKSYSGIDLLNSLINLTTFNEYEITMNKPILIRLGAFYGKHHLYNKKPCLTQHIIMSNPCFIINTLFAKSFISHLKQINTTSDIFIHSQLPEIDKSIQHFTANPLPVYDLSYRNIKGKPIFVSEIIPKGINESDIIRKQEFIARIEYKSL